MDTGESSPGFDSDSCVNVVRMNVNEPGVL